MPITLSTERINTFFASNDAKLRRIATRICKGSPLTSPGTLLHNAYLELREKRPVLENESHLIYRLIRMLSHDLLDIIRRASKSRPLSDAPLQTTKALGPELEVRDAVEALRTASPRAAEIFCLHYFEDLKGVEIGRRLGISHSTVKSDLRAARAWIHSSLSSKRRSAKVAP